MIHNSSEGQARQREESWGPLPRGILGTRNKDLFLSLGLGFQGHRVGTDGSVDEEYPRCQLRPLHLCPSLLRRNDGIPMWAPAELTLLQMCPSCVCMADASYEQGPTQNGKVSLKKVKMSFMLCMCVCLCVCV